MADAYRVEEAPESYGSMKNIRVYHNEGMGRLIVNFDYADSPPTEKSPDSEDYQFDDQAVFTIERSGEGVREPWVVDASGAVGVAPGSELYEYVESLGNVHVE